MYFPFFFWGGAPPPPRYRLSHYRSSPPVNVFFSSFLIAALPPRLCQMALRAGL
jgi:hypothetical protein